MALFGGHTRAQGHELNASRELSFDHSRLRSYAQSSRDRRHFTTEHGDEIHPLSIPVKYLFHLATARLPAATVVTNVVCSNDCSARYQPGTASNPASYSGFSAHLGGAIAGDDRAALLRVARYCARAPVAESRLVYDAERAAIDAVARRYPVLLARELR